MEPLVTSNDFQHEVMAATHHGHRIPTCIQCGTCGGSCPNGSEMEHTPRELMALINTGHRDAALESNTMWQCLSCYFCTSRCPQEIPITDVMYTLKRMATEAGKARGTDAPALARTFTAQVERYGRSFELGIATRYLLMRRPFSALKSGGLGLALLRRGRMALTPARIEGLDELQAIIGKAREMGGAS